MNKLIEFESDLEQLNNFSLKLANKTKVGDLFLLSGDLGVGKTTFARSLINSLYDIYNLTKPEKINSPSFPIMINYSLKDCEIYHYDFYRLKNKNELKEIGFFEELEKNITIIEWPEIILNNYRFGNYYFLELKIIDLNKRLLKLFHTEKKQF